MKKLYQVLDDYADSPQLHKPHGVLDTLFIRGRLRLISAAVRVNMQFLCCWRLRNEVGAPSCAGSTYAKCSTCALKSVSHWKKTPMGAALSFLGQKLFASFTLINARCENISCCTSVAAVQSPIVRWTGGFLWTAATGWPAWTATSRSTWESPCACTS